MAKYSEIKNNQTIAVYTDITWASNGNLISDKIRIAGQENTDISYILNPKNASDTPIQRTQFAIDAINIDWNGAEIEDATVDGSNLRNLKTTGDLVYNINKLAKHVDENTNTTITLGPSLENYYIDKITTDKYGHITKVFGKAIPDLSEINNNINSLNQDVEYMYYNLPELAHDFDGSGSGSGDDIVHIVTTSYHATNKYISSIGTDQYGHIMEAGYSNFPNLPEHANLGEVSIDLTYGNVGQYISNISIDKYGHISSIKTTEFPINRSLEVLPDKLDFTYFGKQYININATEGDSIGLTGWAISNVLDHEKRYNLPTGGAVTVNQSTIIDHTHEEINNPNEYNSYLCTSDQNFDVGIIPGHLNSLFIKPRLDNLNFENLSIDDFNLYSSVSNKYGSYVLLNVNRNSIHSSTLTNKDNHTGIASSFITVSYDYNNKKLSKSVRIGITKHISDSDVSIENMKFTTIDYSGDKSITEMTDSIYNDPISGDNSKFIKIDNLTTDDIIIQPYELEATIDFDIVVGKKTQKVTKTVTNKKPITIPGKQNDITFTIKMKSREILSEVSNGDDIVDDFIIGKFTDLISNSNNKLQLLDNSNNQIKDNNNVNIFNANWNIITNKDLAENGFTVKQSCDNNGEAIIKLKVYDSFGLELDNVEDLMNNNDPIMSSDINGNYKIYTFKATKNNSNPTIILRRRLCQIVTYFDRDIIKFTNSEGKNYQNYEIQSNPQNFKYGQRVIFYYDIIDYTNSDYEYINIPIAKNPTTDNPDYVVWDPTAPDGIPTGPYENDTKKYYIHQNHENENIGILISNINAEIYDQIPSLPLKVKTVTIPNGYSSYAIVRSFITDQITNKININFICPKKTIKIDIYYSNCFSVFKNTSEGYNINAFDIDNTSISNYHRGERYGIIKINDTLWNDPPNTDDLEPYYEDIHHEYYHEIRRRVFWVEKGDPFYCWLMIYDNPSNVINPLHESYFKYINLRNTSLNLIIDSDNDINNDLIIYGPSDYDYYFGPNISYSDQLRILFSTDDDDHGYEDRYANIDMIDILGPYNKNEITDNNQEMNISVDIDQFYDKNLCYKLKYDKDQLTKNRKIYILNIKPDTGYDGPINQLQEP